MPLIYGSLKKIKVQKWFQNCSNPLFKEFWTNFCFLRFEFGGAIKNTLENLWYLYVFFFLTQIIQCFFEIILHIIVVFWEIWLDIVLKTSFFEAFGSSFRMKITLDYRPKNRNAA